MRVRRSLVVMGLALALAGVALGRSAPGQAQTATWSVRAVLPVPVTGAAASVGADGKIYVFGGNTFSQSVTNAEVFDPATNTVTPIAPLPVGLSFMSATLGHDGKIYIAGGWQGSETTGKSVGTLLAYDPGTNTYACSFSGPGCASSSLPPLPIAVSEEGVTTGANGLIIVVAGFATAPTNAVQAYDPVKNLWYMGPKYPTPDAGLRAVTSPGGVLYAGLGFDGQNYVRAIHYLYTRPAHTTSQGAWRRNQQVPDPFDIPFPWDSLPPLPDPSAPDPFDIPFPEDFPPDPFDVPDPFPDLPELFPDPFKYDAVNLVPPSGTGGGRLRGKIVSRDPVYYGTDASDLYFLGGENGGKVSRAVIVYHLATHIWEAGPALPTPTEDATTATARGVVYLIGGDNGTSPSAAILGYNAPPPPGPPARMPTPTPTATSPAVPATATTTPTPSPTPTSTPTPLPTPTHTPVPLSAQVSVARRSVKSGRRQTVTVQTEPGASVAVTVTFPSGKKLHHSGTADSAGQFTWRFTEPKNASKGKRRTVSVKVTVADAAGQTASSSTHYSG